MLVLYLAKFLNLHTMIESLVGMHVPIVFEQDNTAAIAVMNSGYSAKLRHCGRVHRVNVASIHEQLETRSVRSEVL